jgi:adenylate cyclase
MLLLGVALAGTGLTLVLYAGDRLRRLELDSVDARFAVRGAQPAPRDVLIVAIDTDTLTALGRIGDWPRTHHADVMRRLKRAGARVIAYDVQFSEPSDDPEADLDLAQAVFDSRPVVLAATETDGRGATNILGGEENLRDLQARAANALLPDDPGRVLRRAVHTVGGLETFAVAAVEGERGGRAVAPPPPETVAWIDYRGPERSFRTVSFRDVLRAPVARALVAGRTVIVGPTAESLQDVHATPFDAMSGVEVQANAIVTARSGFALRSVRAGWNEALIVLLGALAPLAGFAMAPLRALGAGLVAGGVLVVGSQVAFQAGTVIAVVYPLAALALSAFGSVVVHYLTEVRERERQRTLFARFVPESVVDEVIARAGEDDLRLGGTTLDATVLFSDLRGFTSFAEALEAATVIDVLNRYLGEMSEAILNHSGTIVSYMGDGIMAVFGAPLAQPDHADHALAAATEMLTVRLPRFNEWLTARGLPGEFRIGIGLNSGPVMSGNVGSERRVEYTAVGDTTNTASRLEGLTKSAGRQLLVADSTRSRLSAPDPGLICVGELAVRGREAGLVAWTLEGPDEEASSRAPLDS